MQLKLLKLAVIAAILAMPPTIKVEAPEISSMEKSIEPATIDQVLEIKTIQQFIVGASAEENIPTDGTKTFVGQMPTDMRSQSNSATFIAQDANPPNLEMVPGAYAYIDEGQAKTALVIGFDQEVSPSGALAVQDDSPIETIERTNHHP